MKKHLTLAAIKSHFFILVGILAGCQTHPEVAQIKSQFKHFHETDPGVKELMASPVIDIHSHNFDAHDIPIRKIALGRRDCLPPWSWLATDSMAELLAAAILAETQPEDEDDRKIFDAKSNVSKAVETARKMALDEKLINSITNRSQYSAIGKAARHATSHSNEPLSLKEITVLRSIAAFSTHKPAGFLTIGINELLDEISPFIVDLKLSDVNLAQRYWEENSTDIKFRIAHMMDMGPTYAQQTAAGKSTGYGIGWFIGHDRQGHPVWSHSGGAVGGMAILQIHPDSGLVVAIVCNFANPSAQSGPLDNESIQMITDDFNVVFN